MSTFSNKTVLITGGASGIGKIMARKCLELNAKVIIWDINESNLEAVKKDFQSLGEVFTQVVDISTPDEIFKATAILKDSNKSVDILINNAGIIVGKYFDEHTISDIQKTMEINAMAPMYIAQAFLPTMINNKQGHICNIASSAGLISNPKMSVYCASKWAVIGWSDSLRIEMQRNKTNVKVTTVTPYYINTGMFDGVKSIIPILKPETAARKIIRGIEKNSIYVSMPWSVHFVRFAQAVLPIRIFDWFVGGVLGVYNTMNNFTGRK